MAAADSGFELYIEEGPERGKFIRLALQSIKIGRKSQLTQMSTWLTLADPTLSQHHATMVWDAQRGQYRLIHRSRTNPTLVNGRPIDTHFLSPNDTIQMGKVVLRLIRREQPSPVMQLGRKKGLRARHISAMDRILLYHNLSIMLDCGIPLVRAVDALAEQTDNAFLEDTLRSLETDLMTGSSLSQSMQVHSPPFGVLEVGLVRAGEASGTLPRVLRNLADNRQKDLELMRQVTANLTYPLTVLVCGVGLILFLGRFAFKALLPVLLAAGVHLPWITGVLVALTQALDDPLVVGALAGLAGLAVWGSYRWQSTPHGLATRDAMLLSLPLVGPLLTKVGAARFCYTLNLLYRSGVPMVRALQEASASCGNAGMALKALTACQALSQGHTLAESLAECHIFPWFLMSMVDVGETTGHLDDMLRRAAILLDLDVRDTLERAVRALEPLTIAAMGFFVGFILLAAFLPIYSLVMHLE